MIGCSFYDALFGGRKIKMGLFFVIIIVFLLGNGQCYAESENSPNSIQYELQEYICGDFYYTLDDNGNAILRYYSGNESNLILPTKLNDHCVIEIFKNTFIQNDSLTSLTVPGTIKTIDSEAFNYCYNLKEVIISDGVIDIQEGAFCECESLESITIPNSCIISSNPFICCDALKSIIINDDHPALAVIAGVLFDKELTTLISYPGGLNDSCYSIPINVKRIGRYAFFFNNYLCTVVCADQVEIIDQGAFEGCVQLESIILPNSVTTIGIDSFSECYSLQSVRLSTNTMYIGYHAFLCDPQLTTLFMPDSIIHIGEDAFDEETITLIVSPGSYSEQYAIDNSFQYCLCWRND